MKKSVLLSAPLPGQNCTPVYTISPLDAPYAAPSAAPMAVETPTLM